MDADGDADLVVANALSHTLTVLLGDGHGAFGSRADYPTANDPESVALGDLNRDGVPDIVSACQGSVVVSVLLGVGTGAFAARTDVAVGAGPSSVAIADLDKDGVLDLVTANHSANTASVLHGRGDGTFDARTDYGTGLSPASVVVGDLNADGWPDVTVACAGGFTGVSGSVSVLLNLGGGTFASATSFDAGERSGCLAVSDLDDDGVLDLAVANHGVLPWSMGSVSILIGQGDGEFRAGDEYTFTEPHAAVAIGDLDADGHADLVLPSGHSHVVAVMMGNGDGTFGATCDYPAGGDEWSNPIAVAIGDLNGDGRPDLAVPRYGDRTLSVLLHTGEATGVGSERQPEALGAARLRAWPNPTGGAARLSFRLHHRADVTLSVYDMAGRLVEVLVLGSRDAGAHETTWDPDRGATPGAGVYVVELRAGRERAATRLAVLR